SSNGFRKRKHCRNHRLRHASLPLLFHLLRQKRRAGRRSKSKRLFPSPSRFFVHLRLRQRSHPQRGCPPKLRFRLCSSPFLHQRRREKPKALLRRSSRFFLF